MIAELIEHHGVHSLSAVLKRSNARSLRLLERLGFEPAPEAPEHEREIEPDERIMLRSAKLPGNRTGPAAKMRAR